MRIGYACLTVGVNNTSYKTCLQKNASEGNLRLLISHNLKALKNVIIYNADNNIQLFRISSDIIPFGSSPVNKISWWQEYASELKEIGQIILQSHMRVSMHPGQYTVLNSPNPDVVSRAIADLEYHTRFLDSLSLDSSHKIILHVGGIYQDKQQAILRFTQVYSTLSSQIKNRLVIENDDRLYNIEDVLEISHRNNIPVVYDNLHHFANPSPVIKTDAEWINMCQTTWKKQDGVQKIHYSEQDQDKRVGAHSSTIHYLPFMQFFQSLKRDDIDIMLEVKDKNLSAVKINHLLHQNYKIAVLEEQWRRYKYTVLEKSATVYNKIRALLKDKTSYPVQEFYALLEPTLELNENIKQATNAISHVWGYFKKTADKKEKEKYMLMLNQYEQKAIDLISIKRFLFRLASKYHEEYLLQSYYFLDTSQRNESGE